MYICIVMQYNKHSNVLIIHTCAIRKLNYIEKNKHHTHTKITWKTAYFLRPRKCNTFYRIFSSWVRGGEDFFMVISCLFLLVVSLLLEQTFHRGEEITYNVCPCLYVLFIFFLGLPFSSQPIWILSYGKHSEDCLLSSHPHRLFSDFLQ